MHPYDSMLDTIFFILVFYNLVNIEDRSMRLPEIMADHVENMTIKCPTGRDIQIIYTLFEKKHNLNTSIYPGAPRSLTLT